MERISKRPCLDQITPYVPGKPIEEVERELGIKGVIKLASNENPLGPSSLAQEAIKEFAPEVGMYPDGNCFYLKGELADYLGVTEKNIVMGNGADDLITLAGLAYLNPGDEIIMAQPTFSQYEFSARLMDAIPVKVPSQDFRHDLNAINAAITDKTKIIFICNPNNPTGTIVTREEMETFIKKIPTSVLVVIDEAYYEYASDPKYPQSIELLKEGYNVFILRTFSKIFGLAGLRIGYGLAPENVVTDINTVREPFNVNAVAQYAARAALKDKKHVEEGRRINEEGKIYLAEEFERLNLFHLPTEANFVFVDVGVDSRKLFPVMLKKGVIVRTGDIFGYPEFIRLTIGTQEQNRRFIKAFEESIKELQG